MNFLDAALSYAARGWPVLPLNRGGKTPLGAAVPNGHKNATTDGATIREWWRKYPNANVGIRVGVDYNLLVLDVDNKGGKDGGAALAQLEERLGPLPANQYTVRTPTGGIHLYFPFPRELIDKPIKRFLTDDGSVEVKFKGYVVAPPSVIDDVNYAIATREDGP